jgi:8-oxo-dGTP pyrophosphatase MutT (NUDIX family)
MSFLLFKRAGPAAAAGAVIIAADTKRLLLQQRANYISEGGTWNLIGGGIDPGESAEQAVFREIEEEAGHKLSGDLTHLHTYKNGDFRYYSFLLTVPAEFEPKLNGEAQDCRWTDIDDLPAPLHYGFTELLPKLQIYLLKNSK